jgi:phosphonate transport system permease protein
MVDHAIHLTSPVPSDAEMLHRYRTVLVQPLGRRLRVWAVWAVGLVAFFAGLTEIGVTPERTLSGLTRLAWLLPIMFPPDAGDMFGEYLFATGVTVAMALVGTVTAATIALALGFLAARNTMPLAIVRFSLRRLMDMVRGVDMLIWAMIFVAAVGLGPFAGVLALALKDAAVLGKLLSETIENADSGQVDSVLACGATPLVTARFGYLPQVLPIFISHTLYFLESNTRAASVLGIVGAGGIGFWLNDRIGVNDWQAVTTIILLLLVAVATIDYLSGWLRRRLVAN